MATTRKKTPTCRGPSCNRTPWALGLCLAHYRQNARGGVLRPITARNRSDGQATAVVSVRLTTSTVERLKRAAVHLGTGSLYATARAILEAYKPAKK